MILEEIPRGPVIHPKSGSVDLCDNYHEKMGRYREAAIEEARRTYHLNIEANQVLKYIKYIQGEQRPSDLKKYRSPFVNNRINKARVDHLAKMTDMRPIMDVTSNVPDAYDDVAKAVAGVIRYEWINRSIDMALVTVADLAGLYGTAFARMGAAKPGVMRMIPCGPDQVMPIQPGKDIQESTAVLHETWKAVQWVKQRFPLRAAGIEREASSSPSYGNAEPDANFKRPNTVDEITWSGLAPGMKRLLRAKQAGPLASADNFFGSLAIQELFVDDPTTNDSSRDVLVASPDIPLSAQNWWYVVKPGQRLWPRKRHMIFGGSRRILSDGPSPYWHGLYPYATLQFNPIAWSFWGLSKYRDLLPIQDAMNEIIAGVMDLVKRAVNPVAISSERGINPTAWRAFYPDQPGLKLRVGGNIDNLTNAMKYMDPPNIPAWVMGMLQSHLAPEFDRASGSVDVTGMGKKKQVPGGDTLEQMRDSLQTSDRLEERQIEMFLGDAGKQAVSNVLQFYTAKQRMRLIGADGLTRMDFNSDIGTLLPEDPEEAQQFWTKLALKIGTGSLHSGAKDRTKQVAIALAARHQLPLLKLYEVLEMPNPEALLAQLAKELQMFGGGGKGRQSSDKTSRGQRNGGAV